jgi:acyl-CoA dehydrogenase
MPDIAVVRAFLDERHARVAADAATWAKQHLAPLPHPEDDDSARRQARDVLHLVGKAGWFGYAVPKAFGGQADEPDLRACCLVREALASVSTLADAVFALQGLGSMPITLAGDDSLRKKWLPLVVRGEAMAAFAMTEPEAGSDVAAMKTRATREGDAYVLEGRKTFISNAGIADFYTVFAVTDPTQGHRGISCFVVDATTTGLRFVQPQVLSAPHPLGEIAFERCRIPASSRLGAEGDGFKLGMATLDRLRATVAAAACGMAERALAEALDHAKRRSQFGKHLGEFQLVQEKLARMATHLAASRLLVYRAAWEKDRGADRVTVESAMAKAFATESAQSIIDDAVQILGGAGVLASHPVEQLYRAVRALRIYEGTTEIQHLVIASHLLKAGASHA